MVPAGRFPAAGRTRDARFVTAEVVCVKFSKSGRSGSWSCSLAEFELLVLCSVVHVEVTACLHPALISFDGERPDQVQAAFGVGEHAHDIGSAPDLPVEAFEHVARRQVLVVLAWPPEEGQRAFDVVFGASSGLRGSPVKSSCFCDRPGPGAFRPSRMLTAISAGGLITTPAYLTFSWRGIEKR